MLKDWENFTDVKMEITINFQSSVPFMIASHTVTAYTCVWMWVFVCVYVSVYEMANYILGNISSTLSKTDFLGRKVLFREHIFLKYLRYYVTLKVRKFESLFYKINIWLQKTTKSSSFLLQKHFELIFAALYFYIYELKKCVSDF